MDNASNCDALADELTRLIQDFRGKTSRTRCFPHTLNLIAKAFLSFFYRQPAKPTKTVKIPKRGKKS
ncbi:hypothetical protein PAXINDRAFT_141106, partial [Paxillus involutus ATCC 200175]